MSYEIYEQLCEMRGEKPHAVAKKVGVSSATITNWKQGTYTPKSEKRKLLADYFGVTLDYLDTGETTDPILLARQEMRDEVKALADLASKADPEQVKMTTAFLKTIMKSDDTDI